MLQLTCLNCKNEFEVEFPNSSTACPKCKQIYYSMTGTVCEAVIEKCIVDNRKLTKK